VPLPSGGWNLFSYPLRTPQSIPEALASVTGCYATVYGYDATDEDDPWRVYDVDAPSYANSLDVLTFGNGYWISVTHPITVYFGSPELQAASTAIPPQVPATYYGEVVGGRVGQEVTAWVGDTLCGRSEVVQYDHQPVYAVHVVAEDGGTVGCGAPGREVTFHVDSQVITSTVPWDSCRPREAPIFLSEPSWSIYLPLVVRDQTAEAARAK